jgi:hypothetical protein
MKSETKNNALPTWGLVWPCRSWPENVSVYENFVFTIRQSERSTRLRVKREARVGDETRLTAAIAHAQRDRYVPAVPTAMIGVTDAHKMSAALRWLLKVLMI